MLHRRFTTPFSAADGEEAPQINSIDDLTAAFNTTAQTETPPEPSNDQSTEEAGQSQVDSTGTEPQQPQYTDQQKQNYAFAQMRHENAELVDLLGKIAKARGIDFTDKNDLKSKLNDNAIAGMAQRQGVPVELLKEVEQLRRDSDSWRRYQQEQVAATGFNQVQQQYGLNQQELEAFAIELDQAGKNPFTQNIDVLAEYKTRHADEIIQKEVQKQIEALLKKSSVADSNSSTPSSMQGTAGGSTPEKVDSVSALTRLLGG